VVPRELIRIVYRDPEHLPERLTLQAVERLGESSLAWAASALGPDQRADPARAAAELRRRSARAARIDGAIAGTPFFIALIPGYLAYLWQEAITVLRIAALYGRDPRSTRTAAELLVLRGLHPSVQAADEALEVIRATPLPDKPSRRRGVGDWIRSARAILVFGGFLSPKAARSARSRRQWLIAAGGAAIAAGAWALTWVFPVTMMLAMAWSCERDARDFGARAQAFYSGQAVAPRSLARRERPSTARELVRAVVLILSIALPIAFVVYADHLRNTTGLNAVDSAGALVALSVVLATVVAARRV
jgi:hypothetical protein